MPVVNVRVVLAATRPGLGKVASSNRAKHVFAKGVLAPKRAAAPSAYATPRSRASLSTWVSITLVKDGRYP
jgi:hypothetical protein